MQYMTRILLGLAVLGLLGCPANEEETPAKTPAKTPAPQSAPEKKTEAEPASSEQQTSEPLTIKSPKAPAEPEKSPQTVSQTKPAEASTVTEQKPSTPKTGESAADQTAFKYIPENAAFLVSVRLGSVLDNELVKGLAGEIFPIDKVLASLQEQSGVDPRTIERVTFALWPGDGHVIPGLSGENFPAPPGMEAPKFDGMIVVQFTRAMDLTTLEAQMSGEITRHSHNGIDYAVAKADQTGYFMPDPQTLIASHDDDILEVLGNKRPAQVVEAALKSGLDHDLCAVLLLEPFRDLLMLPALEADEYVPGTADLPDQVESATVSLDLQEDIRWQLVVDGNHEQAPRTILKGYQAAGLEEYVAKELPGKLERNLGEEAGREVLGLAQQIVASVKAEADGKQFRLTLQVPPSVRDVASTVVKLQKERMKFQTVRNKLKQIGLALMNYHEAYGMYPFPSGRWDAPPAEKDKLSWRVHILPYLDQQALYEKFKLDESWDSEHNKKLLDQMPEIFKLSENAKPGHTQFVAPAGPGFLAEGKRPVGIRGIIDGTSNTIMVLTVKPEKAAPWTKPGGYELDPAKAAEILAGGESDEFCVLFADASTRFLKKEISAESFKALLTFAGEDNFDRSVLEDTRAPQIIVPGLPVPPGADIE